MDDPKGIINFIKVPKKISIEEFSAILCLDKVYFVHWKESVAVEIDMNRHRRCSSCSF